MNGLQARNNILCHRALTVLVEKGKSVYRAYDVNGSLKNINYVS